MRKLLQRLIGLPQFRDLLRQCLRRRLPLRHIADRRRHAHPSGTLQRAQTDLHRKLAPVPAHRHQLQVRAHGAFSRRGKERLAMMRMLFPKRSRHQNLDPLAHQIHPRVPKERLHLQVGYFDPPFGIDHHHRVRRRFQQHLELLLRFPHAGQIAGHLRVSAQLTRPAMNGPQMHIGQKSPPVLPHPPAFPIEAPVLPRCPQHRFRHLRGSILVRKKDRKALAHYLLGRVPLQPLRPMIPAQNPSFRIQHVDRIVLHAVHKSAKSLFLEAGLGLGYPFAIDLQFQFGNRRQPQDQRPHPEQHHRRRHGSYRRNPLHHPLQPVHRDPDRPHRQYMCRAAGRNEDHKQQRHLAKESLPAPSHQVEHQKGNGEIGNRDQHIRNDMQPEHTRLATQAIEVRHEIGSEERPEKLPHARSAGSPRSNFGGKKLDSSHNGGWIGIEPARTGPNWPICPPKTT